MDPLVVVTDPVTGAETKAASEEEAKSIKKAQAAAAPAITRADLL